MDPPAWCPVGNAERQATRTEVCETDTFVYQTWITVDGERTITGEANLAVISYSYGDTGIGTIAHQIQTYVSSSWGDAPKATLTAKAFQYDDCTTESYTYPDGPLKQQTWDTGEAFFDTTATNAGDIGPCSTRWRFTFTNPGYSTVLTQFGFDDFRCDNATAGRATVGCVIPWYASALTYSSEATPELASHVQRAQASGLPGSGFDNPLTRTTDPAVISDNRAKACSDAPSVEGKSCDEYPLATSQQGLSAGGERRSFDGCGLSNIRSQTGPTGVSICMISATDQSSQGGTNTQFYRGERVLQGDPFRVAIS
ncbi:hypothetical protein OG895_39905 [Streptomyces sp. NBC_00201]|uniref:NucA/NucB deoxyribonuclease domain-containing protein n=1 Tax=unclassified Streptomyces TaxID=2593676 RepID=UPI002255F734|nr:MULTISPECIES: hypothetical protein [unclassified Streptomyces]MCX5063426.1 hypothetical protein [Streptomyces sp. NBC_00452]MCX5251278.1 hypothetical protein [Streptomyces sp. NBC_00201]MCX5294799.1 hypothetical protein [Streptomyces sp. NBC_00183]